MTNETLFKFQNRDSVSALKNRKEPFSNPIKKLFLAVSFAALGGLALFHFMLSLSRKERPRSALNRLPPQPPAHIVPLLVNLKSKEGPQLARVNIYIHLKEKSLPPRPRLEQKLLFLLSGQPVSKLKNKDFQNQIQSQLNAFLSERSIRGLKIQTEMLN